MLAVARRGIQTAERMATLPSLAIFRSFRALQAQDLLYMQAELTDLERRFRDRSSADTHGGADEKLFSRDWRTLNLPDNEDNPSAQWKLALEIRDWREK